MAKPKEFSYKFEKDDLVFRPGEKIIGSLLIDLEASMEVTAVKLEFLGNARVSWSESQGSGKQRRSKVFASSQIMFNHLVKFHERDFSNPDDKGELSQGEHVLPFSFQLPDELPSSYEGFVGRIRYYSKATIITAIGCKDFSIKKVFTVLDILDLNTLPDMMKSPGVSESKHICCCCCASGPIELEFSLDRTGYVPGEWVNIRATIANSSKGKVRKTTADLVQTVKFHARGKTKQTTTTMHRMTGPRCLPHDTLEWKNNRLHLPPVPPSESIHCKIIDIKYFIKFNVHLNAFSLDFSGQVPVVIGTVPLKNIPQYSAPNVAFPEPTDFQQVSALTSDSSVNTTVSPPSYQATTSGFFVMDDEDKEIEEVSYTPKYVYYDRDESSFIAETSITESTNTDI